MTDQEKTGGTDFIRARVRRDIDEGRLPHGVVTRFPPEPNGYLHIGHAKSICLNFGVAAEQGGATYLRFDDTNPLKEDDRYVEAIKQDVRWLGFDWGDRLTHASDYFPQLYAFAQDLIRAGKAYVCSLDQEQMRAYRGTLTEPGRNSPDRNRPVAENLDLFARMRAGEFADGAYVLRARIDMASPNINLRDPVLYRIRKVAHQRTGDEWPIYPTYDYTHCICDALEGITHSLCTLEFEDHRPLYDWVLDNINVNFHPPQIEFSRLGLEYTVMSKRLLHRLVDDGHVAGWDDPRMPTIAGLRRRGYTPEAIREFCARIGVTKQDNRIEMDLLEFCIRADLESRAPRGMAVLDPLKVTITNYPAHGGETLSAAWHPKVADLGGRELPFSASLYIERDDFTESPPKGYKRLSPGETVRLRYAYIIRCDAVQKDAQGNVVALECSYLPDSRSGEDTSGVKPKGVIHWVDAGSGVPVTIRNFERLFLVPDPDGDNFTRQINTASVAEHRGIVEPAVLASGEARFQFERVGYFVKDSVLAETFNRTVSLRDTYTPGA
ncbi:MAG: glutamine--tRNA ligase/YqeY domain fusion protein [Pseudomonadales bacterium]|nr:glutamine--tRNA ligase/YqeY domain fusion protein [Pseudomonadales bacterium]MCP5182940.1 glutamine--tRNA ligase/YqeY domain fusion protein [Pseudomonadales bacterium]